MLASKALWRQQLLLSSSFSFAHTLNYIDVLCYLTSATLLASLLMFKVLYVLPVVSAAAAYYG